MSDFGDQPFPRTALICAAALVGFTVLATAAVRGGVIEGRPTAEQNRVAHQAKPVAARDLRFIDQPDGSVLIEDVGEHSVASTIAPGSNNGFIRGVMRGLARDRKMRGLDEQPPFRLTQWDDGALTLKDSATGRVIELGSFGPDNRRSFAALLAGTEAMQ
jgi:putative photosynthetic complex assembly protein